MFRLKCNVISFRIRLNQIWGRRLFCIIVWGALAKTYWFANSFGFNLSTPSNLFYRQNMTGVALCNGVFITDNCKSSSSQCHQTNLYAGLAKEVEKYIHTQSLFRVPTLAWKCPVVRRIFENLAKISGARKTRQQ